MCTLALSLCSCTQTATENGGEAEASYWVSWQGEVFSSDYAPDGMEETLDTFVWLALRNGELITENADEKEFSYIAESALALEGFEETGDTAWLRMEQEAFEPESGTMGQAAHKDYLFYKQDADAYVCIQSSEDNAQWTVLKMADYGDWFEKEIEMYIRITTGL